MPEDDPFDKLKALASDLFMAFVGLHETFKALVDAGFTEDQALKYLAYTQAALAKRDGDPGGV